MKKSVFFFFLLIKGTMFAFDTNPLFGIKIQESAEGYQQYVGKSFFLRPAKGESETWVNSGITYDKWLYDGKTYTITKISTKNLKEYGKENKKITITAIEDKGNSKIKIEGYESPHFIVSAYAGIIYYPDIDRIPLVFVEAYNDYKKEHVGEIITHKKVKDKYEITDVYIDVEHDNKHNFSTIYYKLKNIRTKESISCPYYNVKETPFEEALRASYKTALIRVEKPENANSRYGETKTIQDSGIGKYSYKDDVIDMIIYGTPKQFNFALKNISDSSLKIIWNEAVFVGLDGSTSKIMHAGIKYSERESDQPASIVIKGAKIDDVATPTANVYYDEGIKVGNSIVGSGWKTHSMFPLKYEKDELGEVRLMLPIQIKDIINEYTFVFKVYYSYDHPELLNVEEL